MSGSLDEKVKTWYLLPSLKIQMIMERRVADDKHKEHQLEGHTWGVVSVSVDASGKCTLP